MRARIGLQGQRRSSTVRSSARRVRCSALSGAQLRLSALRLHLHGLIITHTGMHSHPSIMCATRMSCQPAYRQAAAAARASSCCRCCCAGTPSLTTLSNFAVTSCCCCSAFASSSAGRGREGRLAIVVALNFPPGELSLLGRCKKHLQRF